LFLSSQLPIAVYVPPSFEETGQLPVSFDAHDTRHATGHPLRHAVLNVIRRIADYRASTGNTEATALPTASGLAQNQAPSTDGSQNGNHYLLTSLTLFATHEPCIMCSMALLHSRVKEVFYLIPMERTGGCGGVVCLPKLEGVNHRFGICRWVRDGEAALDVTGLALDEKIDA
jgi:tRNA-specific adenosine deaminase 3